MLDLIASWWNSFLSLFDAIPENAIAITVYVGGTIIALWAWYNIARRLPSPIGGITWIILFALLATPTVSEGSNAGLAPAFIGLIFGILTKENTLIIANLAAILFVAGIGFLIGFLWSKYQTTKQNKVMNG
ncbi:hypothetical protein F4V57_02480 [Acinetobacter qingfengensis]|uniref:Uncharacterized protein n=1 Tax=Acinetobacter qingfengensis TaxID=1262585 RepID=A0A1E7RF02_9GAMM|nr:hypothetical protein [Acinetobacter qingfengensis]KAA8735678.1 hypothetical protein F4V57_02480 [Acinetobacter qingfengensis]OEY97876.1 hypothetical protein BJI46_07340 [Acinetobacter qingfengensis]